MLLARCSIHICPLLLCVGSGGVKDALVRFSTPFMMTHSVLRSQAQLLIRSVSRLQGGVSGSSKGVLRGVQSCAMRAILSALPSQAFSQGLLDAGLLQKVQVCCISPCAGLVPFAH